MLIFAFFRINLMLLLPPSCELGIKGDDFMNKNLKKIPKFNSEDEEAEFWSTHSTVDYWREMEEVEEEIELDEELKNKIIERGMKKMPLTLHLELRLITAAKRIAQRKNIGYKALLCKWIEEGIKTELSTTPP
ncbi:MAG TPA: hypothetical protein EYP22_00175 [Methanosarcinales archaeon]|nr:hypothetical protein [Methanosarcinales archaeon]